MEGQHARKLIGESVVVALPVRRRADDGGAPRPHKHRKPRSGAADLRARRGRGRRLLQNRICATSANQTVLVNATREISSPPAVVILSCGLCRRKKFSQQPAGSLNTFGRNEIEVAPISSALLRIACLVILYKAITATNTNCEKFLPTQIDRMERLSNQGVISASHSDWTAKL